MCETRPPELRFGSSGEVDAVGGREAWVLMVCSVS